MKDFDNKNTGVMFPNEDKTGNQPDFRGSMTNEEGKEFWVSGWKKESKVGQKYLSLAFTEKQAKGEEKPNPKGKGKGSKSPLDF